MPGRHRTGCSSAPRARSASSPRRGCGYRTARGGRSRRRWRSTTGPPRSPRRGRIAQAGLYPANCRLLDPAEAFLNAGAAVGGGLLVLAFESADHPIDPWLDRAVRDRRRTRRHRDRSAQSRNRKRAQRKPTLQPNWRSAFPAHAVPARRPGPPRRHRRDLRDRLHLGRIRRRCTPR